MDWLSVEGISDFRFAIFDFRLKGGAAIWDFRFAILDFRLKGGAAGASAGLNNLGIPLHDLGVACQILDAPAAVLPAG